MIRMLSALLLLTLAWPLSAAPPDEITLPTIPPPAPVPVPKPDANSVPLLTPERLFVVSYKTPVFLMGSPTGIVKVTEEKGPISIRAKFVGGPDTLETRKFSGPQVFVFEALTTGREELFFVPVGAKAANEVFRQLVDSLTAPQPPPVPPGPTDPLAVSVQFAYASDPSPTKAADAAALAAVYRAIAKQVPSIKTAGDLFRVVYDSRLAQIVDRLPGVRHQLGAELAKTMTTDSAAPLTAALQATAAAQLNRFADILGGLK